jgi:hypothetical protein
VNLYGIFGYREQGYARTDCKARHIDALGPATEWC